MPLPPFARFLTLLLGAIQLAMPAVVSVADGAFAKQVRDPSMHVESSGDNQCTPPHAAECAACRFLSSTGSGVAEGATNARPTDNVRPASIPAVESGIAVCAAARSRAPPV